jgi:hypothetical protein
MLIPGIALVWAAASSAAPAPYPALRVEGGFENAQVHATRVEDAAAEVPTVTIGGELRKLERQAIPTRHQHKYHHYHLRLLNTAGRAVRFRYGPFPGTDPHVTCLKTPVVYYDPAERRYETVHDVRAEKLFLGQRDEDRDKAHYWGIVLEFTHRFRKDTAYVAQSFPFTNLDLDSLAKRLRRRPHCTVAELGRSKYDDLPIYQIVVTDPDVPDAQKKGIWLHAGEDPWEFPGMIACAGAARWAAGDDPLARQFRSEFILSCIPIVHPDCVRRGQTNYTLDEEYTDFINFGASWHRQDVPEMAAVKAAVQQWAESGRELHYGESMHSSLSWGSFIRYQYGGEQESERFVTEFVAGKYVPWCQWHTYTSSERNRSRFAHLTERGGLVAFMKESHPGVRYHVSHVEQIVFPIGELPGFPQPPFPAWGKRDWSDEDTRNMRGQMVSHRLSDIEDWGAYRLLALMEYHGYKPEPAQLPPQLICGHVDAYASEDGATRTFSVIYRDVEGRAPQEVVLHLADGSRRVMERDVGNSALHGIRFRAGFTVRAGAPCDYHFVAGNGVTEVRYPREGSFLGPWVPGDHLHAR